MTDNLTAPAGAPASPHASQPRRRTLVAIAGSMFVVYAAMMVSGGDFAYDADIAEVTDHYGSLSQSLSQGTSYLGMVLVAVLLFYGAALRRSLRGGDSTWLGDVPFLGFAALAGTVASWVVLDAALWRAVDHGDESAIRTLLTLGDVGFLPLMASMIAIYVGAGITGLTNRSLPKWLAIPSVAVGVIAPIGLLGFVGAVLLPFWALAVALTVRVEPSA